MDFFEATKIFLWAMTPVGELRVAIPIGLTTTQLDLVSIYFFAVLGNIFAVFIILTFLGVFSRWTSKNIYPAPFENIKFGLNKKFIKELLQKPKRCGVYFFNRFFTWLFSRTRKNHYNKVNKYGLYILPFFVAIPLPITGGWTASLIAFVFGMPFKKAFPLICLGVLLAGVVVSFLTQTGIAIGRNLGGQFLLGLLLISSFIYWFYRRLNKNRNNFNRN